MLFPIPELHLPTEPYAIWEGGFNAEEVRRIIDLAELREFTKGRVGGSIDGSDDGQVNGTVRETDITWLEPAEDTDWIYQRMAQLAARMNYDKFRFDLDAFQPFQYGKYEGGGHYSWHWDAGHNLPQNRKLSFVLGLNSPDEYEGGDLELNVGTPHDQADKIRLQPGQLVAFPSYTLHRVTPVTKGIRMTMVGWAIGPALR